MNVTTDQIQALNLPAEMKAGIESYLKQERQPENIADLAEAIEKNDLQLIKCRFGTRINFGTAGLRGVMGFGINTMNSVTVRHASQGLCQFYLDKLGEEACKNRWVCIGFDGRYNSKYFANHAAAVFLSKGFKVSLASIPTATPLCPFAVTRFNGVCGIQVTASHNPKDDNGYKVYGSDGVQIAPPVDFEVQKRILSNTYCWDGVDEYMRHDLKELNHAHPIMNNVHDMMWDLWPAYKKQIVKELRLQPNPAIKDLNFVYTAMHGVGYRYISDLFRSIGVTENMSVVAEQRDPDPDFSTVAFPNPEESGAMDKAIQTANRLGYNLIISNDPDADRFAAAERLPDGQFRQFTGDELGVMFGAMAFETAVAAGIPKERMAFVASAVSSKFLSRMCAVEGCYFDETLTGFKWIMRRCLELVKLGYVPLLGYEEALGYGLCLSCPDKDGISAAACFIDKAAKIYGQGQTMHDFLDETYKKYGYSATQNSYYRCSEPSIMTEIMQGFRGGEGQKRYPDMIGEYKICRIRDVGAGHDSATEGNECVFTQQQKTDMLTLWFDNGAHITFRGSGTEPKFKYYAEMSHPTSSAEATSELKRVVDAVQKVLIGDRPLQHA